MKYSISLYHLLPAWIRGNKKFPITSETVEQNGDIFAYVINTSINNFLIADIFAELIGVWQCRAMFAFITDNWLGLTD